MKKTIAITLSALCLGAVLTACAGQEEAAGENSVITIGASVTPHAEILRQTAPLLEEAGYTLEIVEYSDYILPNTALDLGELDANFFQHSPYLDDFNVKNDTELSAAAAIHFEPFGIYSDKPETLEALPRGAVIAVPNDSSNEARALLLLEANGIIKLAEDAGLHATTLDITENPLAVEILEVEAAQLARVLPDVQLACINGNYALQGGLTAEDALALEAADSLSAQTYANILAVQTAELQSEKTLAMIEALTHDTVRDFIETQYEGTVVPVF